ncbi:hypothetical protein [Rhodococcoides kyotonense]|uniref:hypothetical protein n=1 Tax=Rhodococcoides kyotonense TaxID=398843 RepID=UPI000B76F8EA|nr:hypothetical protein [Rhodococcus kyotonensis]
MVLSYDLTAWTGHPSGRAVVPGSREWFFHTICQRGRHFHAVTVGAGVADRAGVADGADADRLPTGIA